MHELVRRQHLRLWPSTWCAASAARPWVVWHDAVLLHAAMMAALLHSAETGDPAMEPGLHLIQPCMMLITLAACTLCLITPCACMW